VAVAGQERVKLATHGVVVGLGQAAAAGDQAAARLAGRRRDLIRHDAGGRAGRLAIGPNGAGVDHGARAAAATSMRVAAARSKPGWLTVPPWIGSAHNFSCC
jgi:hypothetical protein